jgi:hypothetical protein
MFKNGRTNVMDAERSGRPSTSTTDEKQEEAKAIILADELYNRRNRVTTSHQSRYGLFFSA